MKTRRFLVIILSFFTCFAAFADGISAKLTAYRQFKPANILLADGRQLKQPLANIFLKNSTLLYMSGSVVKQANVAAVAAVDFEDRHYVKIDTLLAYRVDSVGHDALFCATIIDVNAYNAMLRNNRQITNLDIGTLVQTTTIDLMDEKDILLPMIDIFYYYYKGKYVLVHERQLLRTIPKEKHRILKTFMNEPDFKWSDRDWLMKLLRKLQ